MFTGGSSEPAEVVRHPVEHAVDESGGATVAEPVGQLHRLVQHHPRRGLVLKQFLDGKAKNVAFNHSNAIDRALKELTTAELRAAEMLMAEDAATAVKELLGVLDSVGQTIDEIRSNLRKLGNAGV